MKIALGGHRLGALPMEDTVPLNSDEYFFSDQLKRLIPEKYINDLKKVDCIMRQGECSFHHCMVPHSSLPNMTQERRCAVIVRYCESDAKIVVYKGMTREEFFKDYRLHRISMNNQVSNDNAR